MFTTLLLSTGLAAGQPPAQIYYPPPAGYTNRSPVVYPVSQPVPMAIPNALPVAQPMPMVQAPMGMPPTAQPVPMTGAPVNPLAVEQIKDDKEEAPAPTKYLLERSLAETRLGQIMSNRGIVIYGWTAGSYNVSSASGSDVPVQMNDRANEFLLNQNWLHAEKTIDTSKSEFQFGWVMDWILPGSDYRTTLPRGIWNDQLTANNGGPNLYGIDPFQFYVQAFLPNLGPKGTKLIVGRFATHCGYELVQQPDTPFVSRSYLFQYDPFTHTGAWAVSQLNDNWTVGVGAATGSDTFIDPANRFTGLFQLKWAPPEGKTSLLLNAVVTNPRYDQAEAFPFYNYYGFTLTHKLGEKLSYVMDAGYGHIYDVPDVGFADWYGAANYLFYAHTDKVTSILRTEVFNDTTGFRTGFEGLYTEVTYGIAWKPCDSLIIRPHVRFDYNNQTAPFEGSPRLYTGAIECIIRW